MKYLKLYELKVQKSFIDWLKDPSQTPKREYIASSLMRKNWKLIDRNAPLIELDRFTQKQSGVSIIKSIETDMDLDRDSILANEREVYKSWIDQEWGGVKNHDRFLNTYGLNFTEYELSPLDISNLKTDIDGVHLEKNFDSRSFGDTFNINSIRFAGVKDGRLELAVSTSKEINEDEEGSIKDFLTGQLSDGWGEIYSQKKQKEKIGKLTFETYLEFYWSGGYPTWDISID